MKYTKECIKDKENNPVRNYIILTGNLGADFRYSTKLCCTDMAFYNGVNAENEWIEIKCFDENLVKGYKKGESVQIKGILRVNNFKTKNGDYRKKFSILFDKIERVFESKEE